MGRSPMGVFSLVRSQAYQTSRIRLYLAFSPRGMFLRVLTHFLWGCLVFAYYGCYRRILRQ